LSESRQRKALVTGAARPGGIGQAIVARLTADGFDVVTLDREPGCTYTIDVATDEIPPLDDIDVFVGNAAITTMFGAAHSMKLERWQRDLDVNLTGTFRVLQACLRGMRERRYGRIILISASSALTGLPGQIAYTTSKAGLFGLARTVAAENVTLGITANVILPGMTTSSGVLSMPKEILDAWAATVPAGFVHPDDIADAVAFFASEEAGMITGQLLTVDAGDNLNTRSVTRRMLTRTNQASTT
jgi:NAD(P)-dependent dehydrogenase (short-subunit alcohol dehydrogenase family)